MIAHCYKGRLQWLGAFNVEPDLFGWLHPTGPDEALPDVYRAANDNQRVLWACSCGCTKFVLTPDGAQCEGCRQIARGWG